MITYNTSLEKIEKLIHPCKCPACHNSCEYGSGSLVEGDLKKIAEFLEISEKKTKEEYMEEIERFGTKRLRPKLLRKDKPYGKCVFFDKVKGCTIHPVKPLECKIAMSCKSYGPDLIKWFDINYFLDKDNPDSIREFKIYVESGGETLGLEMKDIVSEEELERIEKYEDLKKEDKVKDIIEDDKDENK